MSKIILLVSILFNTLGLGSQATNLDRQIIDERMNISSVYAGSSSLPLPDIKLPPKIKPNVKEPVIYAKSYLLFDPDSNTSFIKVNETDHMAIASTTKIMTAVIVLENYKLDDVITISKDAAKQIGIDYTTVSGEKITVENLLQILLIVSSNRAAYALAEYINGPSDTGVTKFVKMMNEKSKLLGMRDTDYHDPAGLDTTGYSSVNDLAVITKYAFQKPLFEQIVKTAETSVVDVSGKIKHQLKNSNRLVSDWNYTGAIGVKTGYMPEASHSLVGAATRNGHTLYAIILYTTYDTPEASATEARKLLDWGWQNINW